MAEAVMRDAAGDMVGSDNGRRPHPATAVRPAAEADAEAVAHIYNQGIRGRNATFETTLRDAEAMARRIREDPRRYPVLVATAGSDVVGWASIGPYRSRECYAGVGEFSVYIDERHRGRGVGRQLVGALLAAAADRGYWKLLSRVFPFNAGSRALCRRMGFREVGVYEKHAQLDGRWLDVVIVEKLISENQR
jgi:L-amino acid N-acyltransferase YncA